MPFLFILNLFHHRPNVTLSSRRIYKRSRLPLTALLRATCVGSINLDRHGPHHLDATDPRDMIFALLGIAADQKELERSPQLPSWVPDWSQSITEMLQDVETDHVTLDSRFNASGAEPEDTKVAITRKEGAAEGRAMVCQLYEEIYGAGVFPDRVNSHEVPTPETYSWSIQWLFEIIHLTYFCKQRYRNFNDRLRAAARSPTGGVGFGQDGQLTRVGENRFSDVVIHLRKGITQIKNKRIASEAQRFLATQNVIQDNAVHNGRRPFITKSGHLVLSSEHVERGDVVALISGAQAPFILRRQSDRRYQIVREAYVDGIMDGEAVDYSKCGLVEIV
ncbi:hypothetical protein K458DRAFT_446009 [Lentithecium fluviatile CBS 122367]|uniref:Heterokaryon incompatibility domain-containing protein n=1 Tax=Lentithecium fluviatile CBS 122367 TaxID=1168545 RepID=A0A6G1IMB2_9PLEO|nr:hypothetical protein K458DRAFT_446009 [Lentithecium fluviatile CBS 122367]